MNIMIFTVAAALAATSAPIIAQTVTSTGSYGDVQAVTGPGGASFRLTSDTAAATPYGGIYFGFAPGFTVSSLTSLRANYQVTAGAFGGGSPRFTLLDGSGGSAYIYFGTPNGDGTYSDSNAGAYGSTGNYANLTSFDARVESSGFGGYNSGAPAITFSDFVSNAGSGAIKYITLDVDGGFTGRQQLVVDGFSVNGNAFSLPGGVPEPASWAMMLVGFGAVGATVRGRGRSRTLSIAG